MDPPQPPVMDEPPTPPRALPVPPPAPPVLLTPEVWEVIAGAVAGEIADADAVPDPSVRIPAVGAEVWYLPRLHASPSAQLPEHIDCYVHGVILLADPVTLELLAEVTLSRHPPQHPIPAPAPAPAADPVHFFSKALSETDVAHNRVLVGIPGNRFFRTFRPKKNLQILDVFGRLYAMKRNSWGLINTGWGVFAEGKGMREGDRVVFLESGGDRLVGLRRSFTPEERALARAPEQDVLHLVDRLQGGELVTLTWYPGRSGTFLVEPEPDVHTPPPAQVELVDGEEDEDHTPPPAQEDEEEDEDHSVVFLTSGEDHTPPPAQEDEEEDEDHSVVLLTSGEDHTPPPAQEDDVHSVDVLSSGEDAALDYTIRIPVRRGVRVMRFVIDYFTPVSGPSSSRRDI